VVRAGTDASAGVNREDSPVPARHPFDVATAVAPAGPGHWTTPLDPDWFGAGPHGGHLAAQLLRAMLAEAGDEGLTPRTLTVHFLTRGEPGELLVETTVERMGRSLATVTARGLQGERLVALAVAALGRDRDGPALGHATMPQVPPPGDLRGPSQRAHQAMPPFARQYELRYGVGAPGSGEPQTGGWIRPIVPRDPDHLLTTALTDTWMPSVFAALQERIPTTTVELTVNYLAPATGIPADAWYLTMFTAPASAAGYFREEGEIWSPDGRLLVRSSQLAVFLAGRSFPQFGRAAARL
jgi:acyl-CoA thioesterase